MVSSLTSIMKGMNDMGRQIHINATVNDIHMLIESVKKEYPTICRLVQKGRGLGTTIEPSYNLYNTGITFRNQFYITTDEIYQTVKKLTEDFDRENPEYAHPHFSEFLEQSVEIDPSIHIDHEKNLISGSLELWGRMYVSSYRMEAVDRLYSCFLKQTKRITIKYKDKDPKQIYQLYSFPEADKIVKDYLLNKDEKNGSVKLIIPDDFVDAFRQKDTTQL